MALQIGHEHILLRQAVHHHTSEGIIDLELVQDATAADGGIIKVEISVHPSLKARSVQGVAGPWRKGAQVWFKDRDECRCVIRWKVCQLKDKTV